ncbi:hypothetical protein AVEN_216734-1 [Araneus ventricosus]|uniref:Uncharacterized protein n=1 Tax=Araneus ventricosus TaxID=182803 RepID=A0A4Y2KCS5_ARAVE|nr:hypothetical protein AVEN_216734-1 [Araneus ventricosus]
MRLCKLSLYQEGILCRFGWRSPSPDKIAIWVHLSRSNDWHRLPSLVFLETLHFLLTMPARAPSFAPCRTMDALFLEHDFFYSKKQSSVLFLQKVATGFGSKPTGVSISSVQAFVTLILMQEL